MDHALRNVIRRRNRRDRVELPARLRQAAARL